MNYPIPGVSTNNSYFYANNNYDLGDYSKPVNSKIVVSVDYTGTLPAITVNKYSFLIDQGGAPPLVIDDVKLTSNVLTFSIAKGIPGVTYSIGILAWYTDASNVAQKRTDYLNLYVLDENDNCACQLSVVGPNLGTFVTGDNVLFANDIPRYFVRSTPPSNPNLMDVWYNPATGLYQEYVSNGLTSYWQNLGGPQGPPGAITPMMALYYKAIAAQRAFPTTTKDIFNNSYTLINKNVFVYRNGTLLTPDDGSGVGGYTINVSTSTITLLYPAGAGELISVVVPQPASVTAPIPSSALYNEPLQVLSMNTLSVLRHYADGNIGILFVNGQAFSMPDVTFSGNTVTWNSATYSLSTYDKVFAYYSYSS